MLPAVVKNAVYLLGFNEKINHDRNHTICFIAR